MSVGSTSSIISPQNSLNISIGLQLTPNFRKLHIKKLCCDHWNKEIDAHIVCDVYRQQHCLLDCLISTRIDKIPIIPFCDLEKKHYLMPTGKVLKGIMGGNLYLEYKRSSSTWQLRCFLLWEKLGRDWQDGSFSNYYLSRWWSRQVRLIFVRDAPKDQSYFWC